MSRAERSAKFFDWAMLAYGLMSSHTHLASQVGADPLSQFCKRLHSPLAWWLNRRQNRLGPVFAERPKTVEVEPESVSRLIAYIHNNPVRAGVVEDPSDSDWTSHRAYVGLCEPPPWIDVELGLSLCGFSSSPSGRQAFHHFVLSTLGDEQDGQGPLLRGDDEHARRADLRERHGAPVEATSSRLVQATSTLVQDPVVRPGTPIREPWPGDLRLLLHIVAAHTGVRVEAIQSRSKKPEIVAARRVAVIAAYEELGRTMADITALLGISGPAGCNLLRRSPERVLRARVDAVTVADQCRQIVGTKKRSDE